MLLYDPVSLRHPESPYDTLPTLPQLSIIGSVFDPSIRMLLVIIQHVWPVLFTASKASSIARDVFRWQGRFASRSNSMADLSGAEWFPVLFHP